MQGEFAERLAAGQADYERVGEGPDGPEPGLYKMQLQGAEMRAKASDGTIMIKWDHLVLEGAEGGNIATDFSHPQGKPFAVKQLKARVAKLGWEVPTQLSEYEELVAEIAAAAPIYMGRVVHRAGAQGVFSNVIIESLIEQQADAPPAAPAAAGEPATSPARAVAQEPLPEGFAVGARVSFRDDDGQTRTGAVMSADPKPEHAGHLLVMLPDGEPLSVPGHLLTTAAAGEVNAAPEPEPADDPPAGPDDLDELIAFAQAQGFALPETVDTADMVSILNDAPQAWRENELTPDELAMFRRVGVEVEKPKPVARATARTVGTKTTSKTKTTTKKKKRKTAAKQATRRKRSTKR